MACHAIHSWTFCALVGAFLDLVLAYFMLCGAAFAFVAAKFLGVLGLRLPCPCGGLFGRPSGHCLQQLLVEYPPRIVSSVQMSVRRRFPFDSVWAEEEGSCGRYDVKFVRDEGQSSRLLEMAGEAESCGSVSNLNVIKSQNWSSGGPSSVNKGDWPDVACSPWGPGGGSDVKGKGEISSLKPRLGPRRRRRAATEQRRSSAVLPCDPQLGWQGARDSYHSMSEQMQENSGNNVAPSNSGDHYPLSDNLKPSDSIGLVEGDIPAIGSTQNPTTYQAGGKDLLTGAPEEHSCDRNEVNTITILEQALREERAVRSALYFELEKERSAASSAADEAMAMILRLQKEKASIEMEARQYQRMVEEKTAYDEEEMNILKEIIVRREREKHVLEKEVELYRQMMVSGEGSEQQPLDEPMIDMIAQKPGCSSEFADGAEALLQQLSDPIIEKETLNCDKGCLDNGPLTVDAASDDIRISDHPSYKKGDNGSCSVGNLSDMSSCNNEQQSWSLVKEGYHLKNGRDAKFQSCDKHHNKESEGSEESNMDFQEKGMLTVGLHPSPRQSETSGFGDDSGLYKLNKSKENTFQSEASIPVDKSGEHVAENLARFPSVGIAWENSQDAGEGDCKSYCSHLEAEQCLHDVHVIDDKCCEERNEKGDVSSQVGSASVSSRTNDLRFESDGNMMADISRGHLSSNWLEAGQNVHRSSSDLTGVLLPLNTSCDSSSFSELRRNSMSAVGKERLKLETEVECLRERLKIVQQGREKLNLSVENKDKENLQLQLLEEIASQLREIRQLTEPGKAMRQVSLPPSSSHAISKKRRCRSVPWEVHGDT